MHTNARARKGIFFSLSYIKFSDSHQSALDRVNTFELIFSCAGNIEILFQYFDAYSNYVTHEVSSFILEFAIKRNESFDTGKRNAFCSAREPTDRVAIARNRGRSRRRYIGLNCDYNSRMPPKSSFVHVFFALPADHRAGIAYGQSHVSPALVFTAMAIAQ